MQKFIEYVEELLAALSHLTAANITLKIYIHFAKSTSTALLKCIHVSNIIKCIKVSNFAPLHINILTQSITPSRTGEFGLR
jgi:hypothetical protein